MPSIYRKLYIKLLNEEIKKENELYENKGKNNGPTPTNDEVLEKMREFAKMDKENKTGLNLESKLKPRNKIEKYYDESKK